MFCVHWLRVKHRIETMSGNIDYRFMAHQPIPEQFKTDANAIIRNSLVFMMFPAIKIIELYF